MKDENNFIFELGGNSYHMLKGTLKMNGNYVSPSNESEVYDLAREVWRLRELEEHARQYGLDMDLNT